MVIVCTKKMMGRAGWGDICGGGGSGGGGGIITVMGFRRRNRIGKGKICFQLFIYLPSFEYWYQSYLLFQLV